MKYYFIIVLALIGCQVKVSITEAVRDEADVFVIKTENATYEYEKKAGGFRSIIDNQGRDWIRFSKSDSAAYPASAASDYRGLPNLVFRSEDGGAGHPGFSKMTTERISANQLRSTSVSGKWSWTWTFHPDHARMEIEKVDQVTPYWFLYEGPVAGQFSPPTHLWGTDTQGPMNTQPDLVKGTEVYGQWQTAWFGDSNTELTFFVHQENPDNHKDMFAYMGNSENGNDSADGMAVFGFGRDRNATPLMKEPNSFIIGFYPAPVNDQNSRQRILEFIENL